METLKISASTDAVVKEMQNLDSIYESLVKIVTDEFGEQQVETYLNSFNAFKSSVADLMKDMMLVQLAESNYSSL